MTWPTASAAFSPTTSGTVTLESIFQIAKPATPAAMIATMARMMTATFIAPYLLVCPVRALPLVSASYGCGTENGGRALEDPAAAVSVVSTCRQDAMTRSTVDPAGTTVPAAGRMITTVPDGWPVLGFCR